MNATRCYIRNLGRAIVSACVNGRPHKLFSVVLMPLSLSMCLTACAVRLPDNLEAQHSPQELVVKPDHFVDADDLEVLPPEQVLALDDEMRTFLAEIVDSSATDKAIMVNLLERLLISGPYVLEYDNLKTYTASETFHARKGNCLSFTNLFVALAREAGLRVYFQEIRVPDNWERQGETWMYNRHINARVDLEDAGEYVVDFNFAPLRTEFQQRRISDKLALSQYYNNQGVHWMMAGDYELSFLNLQRAITLAENKAYFWTNLGALYHRVGDDRKAESAWLHALEIGNELSAASNLARYYERVGDAEHAAYFQEEVRRYRQRNPYYLYEAAESAYRAGDYEESISSLEKAVRIRDKEELFYRLLGLNYVQLGDIDEARKAIEMANEYAVSDAARHTYNRKLELLGARD